MTNDQIKEVKMAWARGEVVQCKNEGGLWSDWGYDNELVLVLPSTEWRVKPSTVSINGFDVPSGVQRIAKDMGLVFVADPTLSSLFFTLDVNEINPELFVWYVRGLIHESKESAIAHSKALLSFTDGSHHG